MEKINEQMEVIVLSLIFLKNCYALLLSCVGLMGSLLS